MALPRDICVHLGCVMVLVGVLLAPPSILTLVFGFRLIHVQHQTHDYKARYESGWCQLSNCSYLQTERLMNVQLQPLIYPGIVVDYQARTSQEKAIIICSNQTQTCYYDITNPMGFCSLKPKRKPDLSQAQSDYAVSSLFLYLILIGGSISIFLSGWLTLQQACLHWSRSDYTSDV